MAQGLAAFLLLADAGPGLAQTWLKVTNGVPATTGVAVAPGPATTVLAAYANRVYVSSDRGASWTVKSAGLVGSDNIALPIRSLLATGTTWLRGGQAGIFNGNDGPPVFVSGNNGESWSQGGVTVGPLSPPVAFVSMAGDGRVFFAADQRYGVFRSTDAGATWAQVNTGLPQVSGQVVVAKVLVAHGRVFAAVSSGGGIVASSDNGATWTAPVQLRERGGAPTVAFIGKDLDLAEDGTLYAMVENAYVFRSTDGGVNWHKVSDTVPAPLVPLNYLQTATVGNIVFALAQDYSTPTPALRLFRSDNRGDTWVEVALTGIPSASFNMLDSAHGFLYVQGLGGLWRLQVEESTPAPALAFSAAKGILTVCWPVIHRDFGLESTPGFNNPNWSPVNAPRTTNATSICVDLPSATGTGFFRLRK